MMLKYPIWQDILTYISILFLWSTFIYAYHKTKQIIPLIIIAGFLIIGTNMLSGTVQGLHYPIVGEGPHDSTYWQESLNIQSSSSFLSAFNTIQPYLKIHSRIHPPGVMLTLHLLRQIWDSGYFVSAVILVAFLTSSYYFYHLINRFTDSSNSRLILAIFLVLPAIQIYTWSTIDALVIASFIWAIWAWHHQDSKGLILTILCVWYCSFLTYATILLLITLAFDDWRQNRTIKRTLILLLSLAGIYTLMYAIYGYKYISSFFFAKEIEVQQSINPGYTFASFIFTRIENMLEIVVFFGPLLTYFAYQGLRRLWQQKDLYADTTTMILPILGLTGIFWVGAYYTGETARGAMYIYPFLLAPVAYYIEYLRLSYKQHVLVLNLVFLQTVIMQTFGWFSW